jgi:precorrin-8X/cobalt-precorrin-8 methylmutase
MSAAPYIAEPEAIARASFRIVGAEARLDRLPTALRPLAARIVHASGMVEIAERLVWRGDPVAAGRRALADGAPVLVDSRMVAAGISPVAGGPRPRVICRLDAPGVAARARDLGITRSAAAVDLWADVLAGAVVAIGTAPTALFRLLEGLAAGMPRPAVLLAFPVGFVGAAESKAALVEAALDVPYVTLPGRLGGSAMAAAAVNALLRPEP